MVESREARHHSRTLRTRSAVSPSNSSLSRVLKRRAADLSADMLGLLLRAGGKNTYRDVINALWERQPVFSDHEIRLLAPEYVEPDPSEREVVQRIFAAYQKAKQDEMTADAVFRPRGGWNGISRTITG